MEITEGVFPLLMILLFTLFSVGVTLDHDGQQRRAARRKTTPANLFDAADRR